MQPSSRLGRLSPARFPQKAPAIRHSQRGNKMFANSLSLTGVLLFAAIYSTEGFSTGVVRFGVSPSIRTGTSNCVKQNWNVRRSVYVPRMVIRTIDANISEHLPDLASQASGPQDDEEIVQISEQELRELVEKAGGTIEVRDPSTIRRKRAPGRTSIEDRYPSLVTH